MKTIPYITDHHGLVHGPRIVADDESLDACAIPADGTVVSIQRMTIVHGLTLDKNGILQLVPVDTVLALKVEAQVWFLGLLSSIEIHNLHPPHFTEETFVEPFHFALIQDLIV
ncbi:MAG TPA: hypothetical protein VFC44_07390 [Candidatus Saccharimonadales bacterium]|nr:hypothetical protein [Candidatus Saccharimonadales bacterium]